MDSKNNQTTEIEKREWPNAVRNRKELDSALEAGLESGRSSRTTEEIFESVITRRTNG